jgi:hypothetical protein
MNSVVLLENYKGIGSLNGPWSSDHQRLVGQSNEFDHRVTVTFLTSTNQTDQLEYFLLENQFRGDLHELL